MILVNQWVEKREKKNLKIDKKRLLLLWYKLSILNEDLKPRKYGWLLISINLVTKRVNIIIVSSKISSFQIKKIAQ